MSLLYFIALLIHFYLFFCALTAHKRTNRVSAANLFITNTRFQGPKRNLCHAGVLEDILGCGGSVWLSAPIGRVCMIPYATHDKVLGNAPHLQTHCIRE